MQLLTTDLLVVRFDTSWVPRFPIVANGVNLQDMWRKDLASYLSIGAPYSKTVYRFIWSVLISSQFQTIGRKVDLTARLVTGRSSPSLNAS